MESVTKAAIEELIKILSSNEPVQKWMKDAKLLLHVIEKTSKITVLDDINEIDNENENPQRGFIVEPRTMRQQIRQSGSYGDVVSMLDQPLRNQARKTSIETQVSVLRAIIEDKERPKKDRDNARAKVDGLLKELEETKVDIPRDEDSDEQMSAALVGAAASGELNL